MSERFSPLLLDAAPSSSRVEAVGKGLDFGGVVGLPCTAIERGGLELLIVRRSFGNSRKMSRGKARLISQRSANTVLHMMRISSHAHTSTPQTQSGLLRPQPTIPSLIRQNPNPTEYIVAIFFSIIPIYNPLQFYLFEGDYKRPLQQSNPRFRKSLFNDSIHV